MLYSTQWSNCAAVYCTNSVAALEILPEEMQDKLPDIKELEVRLEEVPEERQTFPEESEEAHH
jgi:hypothetical protein